MSKMIVPITYKLTDDGSSIYRSDGASIPMTESNRDYRRYLEWLEEGNTPDPVRTPEEETQKIIDDEVSEIRRDLRNVLKGQFEMILELFRLIKMATAVTNADVDPDLLAKAQDWTQKLNRLEELGDE